MVIVNRKWPRVTSWILLWSFLSLSLYLYLSFYLSLPVFNSEVSLDPSWRNGIRDERSVRLRRLSLSLSLLRADQTGRLLEIDGIARMTGKVSVQCRKKSKSFERVGEKGEGEIGWRRNRRKGECIKSLGDGKLKKVSRFVGRRAFCVPVCVWKYEESYGRVWQKS